MELDALSVLSVIYRRKLLVGTWPSWKSMTTAVLRAGLHRKLYLISRMLLSLRITGKFFRVTNNHCYKRASMKVVCESERLIVRQFGLSDAPFIVRLLNDDLFIRYIADKTFVCTKTQLIILNKALWPAIRGTASVLTWFA